MGPPGPADQEAGPRGAGGEARARTRLRKEEGGRKGDVSQAEARDAPTATLVPTQAAPRAPRGLRPVPPRSSPHPKAERAGSGVRAAPPRCLSLLQAPFFGCARRKLPQNRFGREMSPSPGWLPPYWGRHGVGSAPRHHVALLALAKGTKIAPHRLQEAPCTPTPRSKATASADPSAGGDAPARTPCSPSWARCLEPPWQRRGILLILLFLLLRPQIGAQPSAAPRSRPGPASPSPPAPSRPPLGRPRGSPDVPKGPAPRRIRPYLRSGHRHAAAGTRLGSARQPQRRERGIARLGGQGEGREKKKVREKKRSRTHPLTGKGVVREVANSNEEFRPFLGKPRQGPAALPAAAPCRPRAAGARSGGTGGQCHGHRAARGLRGACWWRRGRAFFLLPPLGCLLPML